MNMLVFLLNQTHMLTDSTERMHAQRALLRDYWPDPSEYLDVDIIMQARGAQDYLAAHYRMQFFDAFFLYLKEHKSKIKEFQWQRVKKYIYNFCHDDSLKILYFVCFEDE